MKTKVYIVILFIIALSLSSAYATTNPHEGYKKQISFPLSEESCADGDLDNIKEILIGRIKKEPFNLTATIIFVLAIIHTMTASYFKKLKDTVQKRYEKLKADGKVAKESHSVTAELLHFLSEVEVVFGLWAVVLGVAIAVHYDWGTFSEYINNLHYTESLFIIVIMTIASSRPILKFFESLMWHVVRAFGGDLKAWWLTILILGPLLGSFITEPAAMTICAYLLAEKFYNIGPSKKFKYATLALLFVNISIGGALTNFAAPPILMVAQPWDWSIVFMFFTFGWKAIISIVLSTVMYYVIFKNDLARMQESFETYQFRTRIQKRFISQEELQHNYDELATIVSKNTKFKSELKAYGNILKERIKAQALRKLSDEEIVKYDIENAIEERFEDIELREVQRIIPGLLTENAKPEYIDPHWDSRDARVPKWVVLVHILFLIWTVFTSHTPALFMGGFFFYLGFFQATSYYQNRLDLKPPLLVAFFLAGLVIHGTLQEWWISPILSNLPALGLNITSIGLTAFNDNASITYLSSLVPNLSNSLKYAIVSGAITGGGLTIIANAPNPVGQSILKKYFTKGISALYLVRYALPPTIIAAICFLVFK